MARQLTLGLPRKRPRGRPRKEGARPHLPRPRLSPRHPVHVTLRLVEGLPSLRRKDVFRCLKAAVATARAHGFAVAQFSILGNHAHFLLEPRSESVSKVFQSLSISFARRLNHLLGRGGAVFAERYHLRPLRTPAEVRNALGYVLGNESKHRGLRAPVLRLDPFSSAMLWRWADLRRLFGTRVGTQRTPWAREEIASWLEAIVRPPETWLLRVGWTRA